MAHRGPITRLPQGQAADYFQLGRLPWWFPAEIRNRQLDAFALAVDFSGGSALGANTTAQQVVAVPGDAAFLILSSTAVVTNTDDTTFIAFGSRPITVTMSTTGGGRFLASGAVHIDNWFGTAQQPKYWDAPKVLSPNENLTVLLSNLSATARHVRLAFHGFKVFGFAR
jgi:hypothetical protein